MPSRSIKRTKQKTHLKLFSFSILVFVSIIGLIQGFFFLSHVFAAPSNTGSVQSISPVRVLDSRTTVGGKNKQPLSPGETYNLKVLGVGGVPNAGVSSVVVNITVVNPTVGGYLTLYASGTQKPTSSNINFNPGVILANQAVVPVGSNGQIAIYNYTGNTHIIIDVAGWIGTDDSPPDGKITTISPTRVLDSRTTNGGRNGVPLGAGETMTLPVLGTHGLPSANVAAVIANITAIPSASTGGYLSIFPSDKTKPLASNVNVPTGVITATLSLIPVGPDGAIKIFNYGGSMHVIVDIQGLVAGGDPYLATGLQATNPTRILDTRTTLGGQNGNPIGSNQSITVPILGVGPVPPTNVSAAIVHITAVNLSGGGYLTLYPSGYVKPTASTLNFTPGTVVSNTTVVPVGPDGAISIYNYTGATHAIIDIQGWIASPNQTVTLPSAFDTTPLTQPDSIRARQILANTNKYLMTTWWDTQAPTLLATTLGQNLQNDEVRRLSMAALSLSTAIATGAYDETTVGVSKDIATTRTIQLIDRVAAMHVSNNPNGWGAGWQTSLWASLNGRAAWFLWPQLSAQTQKNVARMVDFEANYAMGQKIHYMRDASGAVLTAGDTGSDDTSWWATPIQLAIVMFPNHPHSKVWKYTMAEFALASWARPSDILNSTNINGAAVSQWINGSNVEADGTVINHSRVAPDYSTLIYQNTDAITTFSLAGKQTPQAIIELLAPVYNAYQNVNFSVPPYNNPGGTIYVPNSASIYYPQGIDWGTGQMLPYALVDAEAAAYGLNTTTSAQYEQLHAEAQLALQARFTDGHTFLDNTEYNYVGREEHTAQLASQLYLTKYIRDHNLASFTNESYWLAQ